MWYGFSAAAISGGGGGTSYQLPITVERRREGKPHRGKVLAAIQPHCDDIPIYAGGTVLKLLDEGYEGILITMTDDSMAGTGRLHGEIAADRFIGHNTDRGVRVRDASLIVHPAQHLPAVAPFQDVGRGQDDFVRGCAPGRAGAIRRVDVVEGRDTHAEGRLRAGHAPRRLGRARGEGEDGGEGTA